MVEKTMKKNYEKFKHLFLIGTLKTAMVISREGIKLGVERVSKQTNRGE